MSLPEKKTTFTFNHADQPDNYGQIAGSGDVVKANFDSRCAELLAYINANIDALPSVFATIEQEDWKAPTLLNGWANIGGEFETAGYFKDKFGIVHLAGVITNASGYPNQTMFVLPEGYRPTKTLYFLTGGGRYGSVFSVKPDGNVVVEIGASPDSMTSYAFGNSFRAGQ